ncbi:MAG: adenylate/guanylate cyclase domain-containing protein, partial [Pseudomonadota bacterium]
YDLWGDTVNTASRMESHGAPGRIQISATTRALLGKEFVITPRGTLTVKSLGEIETFWLEPPDAVATPATAREASQTP